ncbi:DNA polymerase [bacterium]|nr:MAG: DNA polymerase [bacterium]
MVDGALPIEQRPRPLRCLFLDFNSYFASIEQQENPALRGKPIVVAPVDAETTFAIAASYEARRYGVKTGTRIDEARRRCPNLIVVKGDHAVYAAYHERIEKVISDVLPVEEKHSIDEMSFQLLGTESTPAVAREIALEMKRQIRERVGEAITCSIGIAPNPFLAKVATELQKPDGLVILTAADLPHRLYGLKLTDFPGINRRMQARLNAQGILTTESMCVASRYELTRAFGSIVGERWWYLLRGVDLRPEKHSRSSFSHSHVLPPHLRTDEGCRRVLTRLIYKIAMRLRSEGLYTGGISFGVSGMRRSWECYVPLSPTQDSRALTEALEMEWSNRTFVSPLKVWTVLANLKPAEGVTPSLFDERKGNVPELGRTIDRMNAKFGKLKVYPAPIHGVRDTAEERIAFNKTKLLSEGAGDDRWTKTIERLMVTDPPSAPTKEYAAEDEFWWGSEAAETDW